MKKSLAIPIVTIALITIVVVIIFFLLRPKNIVSPISSKDLNTEIVTSREQPSKQLKEYVSDSGFSFNYPDDVLLEERKLTDDTVYEDLYLTSNQTKGNIVIKIADTKIKSLEELFPQIVTAKETKIGDLMGREINENNKQTAIALDQGIIFTIEVDHQNQKYWQTVYGTILSSFNFVPQQSSETETIPLDDSSSVILEEETIE